ncbi:MAG: amidohydrolase family protein [Pseudooceanicola sp.]|nr:amidohydrolase family protein [Pseudooceanicola sp.]
MRLPGVLVPRALVADTGAFGGAVAGEMLAGDLVVGNGRAVLAPAAAEPSRLVLPRFADPHVHLDKCHTAHRMPVIGGDLDAAIAAQRIDKGHWTEGDIRARAARGLAELAQAGCGAVRSHVDWGTPQDDSAAPLAWEVLGDIDTGPLHLQRAALVSMPVLADRTPAERIARQLARDGGVLGAFVNGQPEIGDGLANVFRAGADHDLMLDFHADEGLRAGLDGVERIADAALALRYEAPILIGHACALMNCKGDDLRRIADKLARAGIAVAALPYTNLYLQGRGAGTPDRRGLAPLHELRAAGVRVVLGADNVRDAFCPLGNHDPFATLALAALSAHLDPPFEHWLATITTDARLAIGLPALTIDTADPSDLLVFETDSLAGLLSDRPRAIPLTEITGAGGA